MRLPVLLPVCMTCFNDLGRQGTCVRAKRRKGPLGTEGTTTTPLMKTTTPHENRARLAIGYIRVSTHEQAQEGVSLDVQHDKLRAYCKLHDIKLVDVRADEGISGGTMERPGL